MIDWLSEARFKPLLLIICMASHLGCVNPGVDKNRTIETTLTSAPADLSPWIATGKLAVTAEGETSTARFEWRRHNLNHDTITVSGPFSINRQIMERHGDSLVWRDGDKTRPLSEISTLGSPLRFLAAQQPEVIGQWLLGYPGNSEVLQLEVLTWQPAPPWMLPEQMTLVSDGLSVRIIVSEWEIGAQQ